MLGLLYTGFNPHSPLHHHFLFLRNGAEVGPFSCAGLLWGGGGTGAGCGSLLSALSEPSWFMGCPLRDLVKGLVVKGRPPGIFSVLKVIRLQKPSIAFGRGASDLVIGKVCDRTPGMVEGEWLGAPGAWSPAW